MVDRIKAAGAAIKSATKKATKRIKKATQTAINLVIPGEHELKGTFSFDVWYPDHPPRKESKTFARTREKLIGSGVGHCWICGAPDDLEAHHFHVEWAFADGVDWERMRTLHPTFDWASFQTAEDFVDSEYNMVILCETHHRHKNHGIHALPYPIWVMQRHQRSDFKLFGPNDPMGPGGVMGDL